MAIDEYISSDAGPAIEVVQTCADPRAVILVLHGGKVAGTANVHRGRLTYLRMVPFSHMWGGHPDVAVWRLRYRYTGWNGNRQDPVRDVTHALAEVRRLHPAASVLLIGHSMGGRAALMSAGLERVSAVCALAPWVEPSDPVRQLRGRDVLIAHGDRDIITDPSRSARFAGQARGLGVNIRYETVIGSGHAMLRRRATWRELVDDFIGDQLRRLPS